MQTDNVYARIIAARRLASPGDGPAILPPEIPRDIPLIYRKASLKGPVETTALVHVRSFLERDSHQCLLLSGPPGCGKTYAAIAGLLASSYRSRRFAFYPAVCEQLIAFASRDEMTRSLSSVRFLALDDFGAGAYPLATGGWTDTVLNGLFDSILTHREANRLPTLITTNLTKPELADRLSPRLKSRLNGAWGWLEAVTGPDLRQTK